MPRFCLDPHGNQSVQFYSHWGIICQYNLGTVSCLPVLCFRTNTEVGWLLVISFFQVTRHVVQKFLSKNFFYQRPEFCTFVRHLFWLINFFCLTLRLI